jgi:hypothetical protein
MREFLIDRNDFSLALHPDSAHRTLTAAQDQPLTAEQVSCRGGVGLVGYPLIVEVGAALTDGASSLGLARHEPAEDK